MAERADVLISRGRFAKSRTHAASLIRDGLVFADGKPVLKPSQLLEEAAVITVAEGGCPYVSRGGLKLQAALEHFCVDVNGLTAVDIGASTGGFTHCLLSHGAKKVYAVDVGTGQLAEPLKSDSRVVSLEKINARNLDKSLFSDVIHIAVMDVSFISQALIYPAVSSLLTSGGRLITLIKPQFELGKQALNRHGVVRDAENRFPALKESLFQAADAAGLTMLDTIKSPIQGGDGNTEYLALFVK